MEGKQVFSDWTVRECIGKGAFGKVYRITREDFGEEYEAALKVIEIPQEQTEVDTVRSEGLDEDSVKQYFNGMVDELTKEISLMAKLKGNSNIVSYEDHIVLPKDNGFGWTIYIRMELLKPLLIYIKEHTLSTYEVVKMGIDICAALELCQKNKIIHRDIKPENIFISGFGNYKLGDFGIARQLERTSAGLSKKGTITYMAPEIYKGQPYNSTVDIYSLGIVLYRFLNNNRAPFLPAAPKPISISEREKANHMRMSGEKIPVPCNVEGRLAEIVLKACAYDPKERYQEARQMRQDLEMIFHSVELDHTISPQSSNDKQGIEMEREDDDDQTSRLFYKNEAEENSHKIDRDTLKDIEERKEIRADQDNKINNSSNVNQTVSVKQKKLYMMSAVFTGIIVLSVICFYFAHIANNNGDGLEEEYTVVDKLKISARMPKGWKVSGNEDKAFAKYQDGDIKKEISFTMDYYAAPLTEYTPGVFQYALLGSHSEDIAADGAEDNFAHAMLYKLADTYSSERETTFLDMLEESAIYEINGRNYYYLQYQADKNVDIGFYFTVKDGAEIYYRLRIENGNITKEDRALFDCVMRSVKMDSETVNYSELRASDYIKDVYKLSDSKTENNNIGIAVNLPAACEILNEENEIKAEFKGNSYSEHWKVAGYPGPYSIDIYSEDASVYGSLENGMNEEMAVRLLEHLEQDQGYSIDKYEYADIKGRSFLRISANDTSGGYWFFLTIYRGKLIATAMCDDDKTSFSYDKAAEEMIVSMVETMEFGL